MSKKPDKAKVAKVATKDASTINRIDPKLLEILVCPVTKQPLEYNSEKHELVSPAARLAYPIRDGIPIMLMEEARNLDEEQK